ncbi:hypothetical protein E4U43_007403 [Claviceps pusilla]|uniref:Uncharacterized protein n=1 Tax=Claviceps pusilla TaxID=123648 RepID=A0A9P7NIP1_9HYPO|nr:hypothetical protein E4U43_007403 [Claviceps pusilla]
MQQQHSIKLPKLPEDDKKCDAAIKALPTKLRTRRSHNTLADCAADQPSASYRDDISNNVD